MVIPLVLQFSCRLPVSVCGTGALRLILAAFLAGVDSLTYSQLIPHRQLSVYGLRTSLQPRLTAWPRFTIRADQLSFRVPASNRMTVREYQPVVHHLRLSAST